MGFVATLEVYHYQIDSTLAGRGSFEAFCQQVLVREQQQEEPVQRVEILLEATCFIHQHLQHQFRFLHILQHCGKMAQDCLLLPTLAHVYLWTPQLDSNLYQRVVEL